MTRYFVAVAGNIGVGKSSLTTLLAQRLGWEPFFETVAENPYLADFYRDMKAWSFHSQIFFLSRRLYDHKALMDHPTSVLQDRTVYEDAEIFARNLYKQGLISERDWASYWDLYRSVAQLLPPPNLVVYLQASVNTLVHRIEMRGRDFERNISGDYLEGLNDLYDDWVAGFNLCPVLTIATDEMDFVQKPEHLDIIAQRIEDRLRGKEVLRFTQNAQVISDIKGSYKTRQESGMFSVGETYNRRSDLHSKHGGQEQGGIATPSGKPFIFLFTSDSGRDYGYKDGWNEKHEYLYTGEGQAGDMQFLRGNLAIRDHQQNNKALYLFKSVGKGNYEYLGEFEYVDFEWRTAPDRDQHPRKVIVFHLREIKA